MYCVRYVALHGISCISLLSKEDTANYYYFFTSPQTGDIVTGHRGVPVTDRAEEVHRCALEFVTSPFLLGAERCAIHWVQPFKLGAAIVMAAQVRSCVVISGVEQSHEQKKANNCGAA